MQKEEGHELVSAGQGHRKALRTPNEAGGWDSTSPGKEEQSLQFDLDQILALPRSLAKG